MSSSQATRLPSTVALSFTPVLRFSIFKIVWHSWDEKIRELVADGGKIES
jgi:hypothetical protein